MDVYFTVVAYIMALLLGLCIGSFLNVIIYRVPNKMNLAFPPSHCTSCNYTLKWYDNIPVLSYLALKGKCRKCRSRISPVYMLVEIFNALLWVLSVYMFWELSVGAMIYTFMATIVSSVLICIFCIDLEHMLIFNRFTVAVAICGIVALVLDLGHWYDYLIGAAAGAIVFFAIYHGAILVLGREGLGFGDVKLAAASGLLLGWQNFLLSMIIASLSGSVILLILRYARKDENAEKEYPFAPFMVLGILFAFFFGDPVINWYLDLIFVF